MTAPSDTPRTDALLARHQNETAELLDPRDVIGAHGLRQVCELIKHARNLERQLSEARAEAEGLRKERDEALSELRVTKQLYADSCEVSYDFGELNAKLATAEREAAEAGQKAIEECVAIANRLKPAPGKYGWPHPTEAHDIELALRALLKEKP